MQLREFIYAVAESREKYTWEIRGKDDAGKRFLRAYDQLLGQYLDPINVVAKLKGLPTDMTEPKRIAKKLGISDDLADRLIKASDYRGDETLQRLLVSAAMRGKRLGDK